MAKLAKKTWHLIVCELEFVFEQTPASRSAKCVYTSPRGDLWYPAVGTGVRTPGSNCWQDIGSTNRFVHRQKERTNILLNWL